jgi:diguanylate cyclase (GGDEF)-like protein
MLTGAEKIAGSKKSGVAGLHPILDVLKEMNSERNLRRLITMILDTMIGFSNAQRGSLGIFKGDRFNAELSRHRTKGEIRHVEIPSLSAVFRRMSHLGRMILVDDIRQEPGLCPPAVVPDRHGLSILCLPLRVKSRLIGAVYLDNTQMPRAFGPRQREFAQILTDHAAIAIENALLHRHTTQDRTTSVSNHPHFESLLESELERARRLGQPCGLLMIDVDNFKGINDLHGHPAGSEVLRHIARILTTTVRGVDVIGRAQAASPEPVVGRYGGDEFEIAIPGVSRETALKVAKRLVAAVSRQEGRSGGKAIKLSISVGVAVYPDDALDCQELILRADEALYQGKRAGKGRAVLCQPRKVVQESAPKMGLLPTWLEDC